ncbi:MAG: chitobiase/beta-hexosaminidase C-terminal domain-containing protein [Clostridia bacterium]|nr:chitobiase/beta-hexosaminidase C-terminal domain-containing protein [Clostridia bacterium]
MICPQCGNVLSDSVTVCPECGMSLKDTASISGAAGIRQGRTGKNARRTERAAPYSAFASAQTENAGIDDYRLLRPGPERVPDLPERRSRRTREHRVRKFMVNWALVWTVILFLVILGAAGGFLYLKTSDAGQLILARMGYDANAEALWALGSEYLDQGYIERAIISFESAHALEPDRPDIYSKLLLLGEAYMAGGYLSKAEALYTTMYTDIDPKTVTAYRLKASILTSQGRTMELAAFLKEAYTATGDASFSRQREELVPAAPTAALAAGKYTLDLTTSEQFKSVELLSAEDYDIYYIHFFKPNKEYIEEDELQKLNAQALPDDGTLYTGPIHLEPGYHVIRTVAISSELISDEMVTTYTVSAPSPSSPKLSLAPGTYQTRQRVWLRYTGKDPVTIYYTIDGQTPVTPMTGDSRNQPAYTSPVYTGEPILLPGGRVHVKAIAVNSYNVRSNEMDVELKIDIKFEHFFNAADTYGNFTLLTTTRDQFVRKYGQPTAEQEYSDTIALRCLQLDYDWGYARFMSTSVGYVVYDVQSDSSSFAGPRSTRCGMNASAVCEKFRDMGQLNNSDGSRSIYWDQSSGYAMSYKDKTNPSLGQIDYVYYTEDGGSVMLTYYTANDIVTKIGVRYSNLRISPNDYYYKK